MKQVVCLVAAIGWMLSSYCQTSTLAITTNKTTSLIFPFPIMHVDRGDRDILVQKVKEADNILLVKAAGTGFPETNLTVITGDGSTYYFTVDYENNPLRFIYHLPVNDKGTLRFYSRSLLVNHQKMHGISAGKFEMRARVSGIWIKDNVMYFQMQFENQSPVDYDIDFLRFYLRDKKKNIRTAIQENELKPMYIAGNTSQVKANSKSVVVIALEKFTIPDAKYLAIEINEKNGGRNLLMKVNNRKIIRAIPLPDLD